MRGALANGIREAWRDGNIPLLRNIGIQDRFTLLIAIVAVGGLLLAATYGLSERVITSAITEQADYQRLWELSSSIQADALAMQNAANGLTAERRSQFIDEFSDHYAQVETALAAIQASQVAGEHRAAIDGLAGALAEAATQFKIVAAGTLALGLGESDGLRGKLRSSAKAMEDELKMWPNTDDLKARMTRLREAEKDFMLYEDESFLGKGRGLAAQFDIGIDGAALPNSTKDDFRAMLTRYSSDMAAFGTAQLDEVAQIGKLRSLFAALQPRIRDFATLARTGMAEATLRQDRTRARAGLAIALVGGLTLAAILLVGLVSGRSIARPVLLMEGAMSRLAAGDNLVEIPGVDRHDEVGLMAKAVQVFRDNALKMEELRIHDEAEQAAKELRRQQLEALISSFDSDVADIIHTLAGSVAEGETAARHMEGFAAQTVARMDEVDQASGAATASVQAMAAAAEQLAYSIEEISARVSEATQVAVTASADAKRTDAIVQSLFEASNRIGTVVTFIQTIASQTRLLALNATIEAARAGEHGHGFTVVANEVKQLADKTSQATNEIASQITAVQAAGKAAVQAIGEIAASVENVNQISGSIAAAVEQQGAATKEIARSAQEAARGTTQVAASINWVAQEAAAMKSSTATMLDTSVRMTSQSEVLRATVDNFLMGVQEGGPSLKWGEHWLTGHQVIDRDHETLVAYVNELSTAMMQSRGRAMTGELLSKLAAYADEHFSREERVWAEGGLPTLDAHQAAHRALLAKVGAFADDFRHGKADLTMDMMSFMREWLVDHVFKADKAAVQAIATRVGARG